MHSDPWFFMRIYSVSCFVIKKHKCIKYSVFPLKICSPGYIPGVADIAGVLFLKELLPACNIFPVQL